MNNTCMEEITVWTASACQGNPGPGGYAIIIVFPKGTSVRKQNGRSKTTRHRMEVFAAIRALTILNEPTYQPSNVTIKTTDIQLFHAVNARDFREIPDLEEHIMPLLSKHQVAVKVHREPESPEYVDTHSRALKAMRSNPAKLDTGYQQQKSARTKRQSP